MDLVFALDSSNDVALNQWTQQKEFMKKVADGFNVQEDGTHAAVVAYSTIPSINMKLGERNVKDEVDKAFDDLPRDLGNRNLVSQRRCDGLLFSGLVFECVVNPSQSALKLE